MATPLSPDETQRYRRQLIMPEIGVAGQQRIKAATVMIAGVGGLGGLSACFLVAAGVGRLKIVDMDKVAVHNLNRQILYTTADIGRWKTDCARARLTALNPLCRIEAINRPITTDTVDDMARDCDLIIDGSDTFDTRSVLNQAALTRSLPFIYGGVNGFNGMVAVFSPGEGACFRCMVARIPAPAAGEIGIIGPTAGVIASLQSMEAIKCLIGKGPEQTSVLIRMQGFDMRFKKMVITRNPGCPTCGPLATV